MVQRKIKLLVSTHAFPTKYNPAAATFILNQLQELKKYCEIKIVFPYAYVPKIKCFNPYYRFSKIKNKEVVDGIEVYHPRYFMIPRILFLSKLLNLFITIESFFSYNASKKIVDKIMKNWNPDVIHIHGPFGDGLIGVRIRRKYKKPLIVTVHGEDVTKYLKKAFSKRLAKFTFKNSDAIICQSRFLENEIKKSGIKDKDFYIIPMGAKTDYFKLRDKGKVRKMLDLPINKKIILFVGHLDPRKDPITLVKSINKIKEINKDFVCCMIGKGKLEKKLKNLVKELNLEKQMQFLGLKSNDEVALYMNACDVFVLPSLMEGLPVVLCEALASGKPVVATEVAGTPELVTKDVGYLVKPRDEEDLTKKIVLALNKKWNIRRILMKGHKFSAHSSAKKLIEVYKNLLKNKDIIFE